MRDYKNLLVWEKAHKLRLAVYETTLLFPKEDRYGLTSQVRRASASIAANLAEGCGGRFRRQMARFVQIAMGSGAGMSYGFLLGRDPSLMQAAETMSSMWTSVKSSACLAFSGRRRDARGD